LLSAAFQSGNVALVELETFGQLTAAALFGFSSVVLDVFWELMQSVGLALRSVG
jgi:hypothetical protein